MTSTPNRCDIVNPEIIYATLAGVSATVASILGGVLSVTAVSVRNQVKHDAEFIQAIAGVHVVARTRFDAAAVDLIGLGSREKHGEDVYEDIGEATRKLDVLGEQLSKITRILELDKRPTRDLMDGMKAVFALFFVGVVLPILALVSDWTSQAAVNAIAGLTIIMLWIVFVILLALVSNEAFGYPAASDVLSSLEWSAVPTRRSRWRMLRQRRGTIAFGVFAFLALSIPILVIFW